MIQVKDSEYQIISTIENQGGKALIRNIMEKTGLPYVTIMKASLELKERKIVEIEEKKFTKINLNYEGREDANEGLPERRILNLLLQKKEKVMISNLSKQVNIPNNMIPLTLGWLIRKKWAILDKAKQTVLISPRLKSTENGSDEKLLQILNKKENVFVEDLSEELESAFKILKKRKLIDTIEKKERTIKITEFGWQTIKKGINVSNEVTQLTPELIITGKWRKVKLTSFNVKTAGSEVFPAKKHPVQQIIQEIKEIFTDMGFSEIRGPIVESAFWNFDALYQPQDHPAREMHDTFYLEYPNIGKLPHQRIVKKVARTHENGGETSSKGWRYSWSIKEAKKLVLRTHTTATTIRYLAEHHKPPVKVFSVDRVYRNEKMDYKHISEFHQVEGIIMDKKVTFRNLIGTLKEFYSKLGLKKVRFWPSYFPYTEPSAQSTVYIPETKKWVELCGMGMFRPEVLTPLGVKHPVLAWGLGLERLIMIKLGVDDIRFLYKNDLGWIRRTPICQY